MTISCFGDFEDLRAAYPDLAKTSLDAPFRSLDWFEHLARHGMTADATLRILCAGGNDTATVCLPLMRQGQVLSGLSNYYSALYGPIAGADGDAATWLAICRHLRNSRPRQALIRLQPLDSDSAFFTAMRQALAAAGYWVDSYFCFGNWYLQVNGCSFGDYWRARPAALQNTVRRGRGKLSKAGDWRLAVHTSAGAGLEQAIGAYEDVYRRSWKPAEEHPQFIRGLCRLAALHGWLRLGVLTLQGQAIAGQIWLFVDGKSHIFKLVHDPAAARYSPGSVLTAAMMEQAIEQDAAKEVDFLSGDDSYKRDWMSHRRERRGLVAFDPTTWKGLRAAARHFAGRAAKRLRVRPAT